MLNSFFNAIFGFLINWNPLTGLLVISLILTLITSLSYKFLTDQKELKSQKEIIGNLQKEIKSLKNDPKKMMEKQKEIMDINFKMMKHNIKPMLITFIPLLIIFGWLRTTYDPIGKLIFGLSWFWIYLISAILFSIVIRKVLKIY